MKKSKKKSFSFLEKIGIIIGIISGIIGIWSFFAHNNSDTSNKETERIDLIDHPIRFDQNPHPKSNFGFATINNYRVDSANKIDFLSYDDIVKNDNKFYIFVDFRNLKTGILKNAMASIQYNETSKDSLLVFNTILSGDNTISINDNTTIIDLPENWKIEFIEGVVEIHPHYNSNEQNCNEIYGEVFERTIPFTDPKKVVIGDLRDSGNGWCDQGFVIATFRILPN